jgi:hypothetical protein
MDDSNQSRAPRSMDGWIDVCLPASSELRHLFRSRDPRALAAVVTADSALSQLIRSDLFPSS